MEARETDISCFSRTVVVAKLLSVKGELKNKKEDHCSLVVGLQLTQKEQKRIKGELEEKMVLAESLRGEAKAGSLAEGGKKEGGRK